MKKSYHNKYLVPVVLFLFVVRISAQEPLCGFERAFRDTSLLHKMVEIDKSIGQASKEFINNVHNRQEITIPVVVHVVWNTPNENISDGQILSQIEVLNQDFNAQNTDILEVPDEFKDRANIGGIRFCLSYREVGNEKVLGVVRKKRKWN